MILAIFQDQRVYEGSGYSLNALYPMPSVSRLVVDNPPQLELHFFGHMNSHIPPLFREDSFDPTSRLRRGRFYTYREFRQYETRRVNHYPYGPPVGGQPICYDMNIYESLQPTATIGSARPFIFLGNGNHKTAWRIIGSEQLFNGEYLFTLISAYSLSILPELNRIALPADSRAEIELGLDRVADTAHRYLPEPVVDVCREFASIVMSAWLPTIGVAASGDLGDLTRSVPDDRPIVRSIGAILSRLHSRGKSSERRRQASKGNIIRGVAHEDAELSLSLVACLLRELCWTA